MIVINCTVKENIPIMTIIDSDANINVIKQKFINELGLTYHIKSNSIEMPDAFYFTLEKVNLHISFEKYKSISSEFIVLRSDWSKPDLILKML